MHFLSSHPQDKPNKISRPCDSKNWWPQTGAHCLALSTSITRRTVNPYRATPTVGQPQIDNFYIMLIIWWYKYHCTSGCINYRNIKAGPLLGVTTTNCYIQVWPELVWVFFNNIYLKVIGNPKISKDITRRKS